MADWIGRTVSKVEIQKLIGRGGMAEVYLGRHTTLDRLVAVKVLQSHLSEDANLLSRFKSEAQAVAAMRHPNIVQVFDFDVVDDRPFIVMEMLEGLSLKEYLAGLHDNNLRLSPRTISHLIASLASALEYAHARGIVHRDIKPANIMLRRETGPINPAAPLPMDAQPVLTDFGVARIANATAHTASGTIIGTPAYMSPEQVRGAVIDSRSDIYSLGIVLYEMLTGQVPFSAETQASVLLQQINDPPPPLPGDYAELQPVIDRALSKEPNQRFQKASDLAAVLAATLGLPGDTSSTEPRIAREALFQALENEPSTVKLEGATNVNTTPVAVQTTIQPPGGVNPLWIAAGIAGLALIVGAVALGLTLAGGRGLPGSTPASTQPGGQTGTIEAVNTEIAAPPPVTSVGAALFRDASLTAALNGLEALPDGSFYQAWLIGPRAQPQSLGKLEVFNGTASLKFTAADGKSLLPRFSGFEISIEQGSQEAVRPGHVVYVGQLDPAIMKDLQAAAEVAPDTAVKATILNGVKSQTKVFDTHITNTINAIGAKDLKLIKLHAEHVVNITVGKNDTRYGDLDGNGKAQNPGDGVGLSIYLRLLEESIKATAAAPDAGQDVLAAANDLTKGIDQAQSVLDLAVGTEQSLSAADSVDEASASLDKLKGFLFGDTLGSLADKAGALDLGLSVEVRPASP
jgi:serine/threonine-protein kinase